MRVLVAILLILTAGAATAQTAPVLEVFVTDQNSNVFVAVYGDKAVELAGCKLASDGRRLLHLPQTAEVVETTLAKLQAEKAYGRQPALPCPGVAFDGVWPATTPIWADLEASGNYYLPAPGGGGYYAVPTACTEIKTALAIRERLQLPGVLQGFVAPHDLGNTMVLDCGRGDLSGSGEVGIANAVHWSLHKFETFLTADSIGDTVYVARFTPPGNAAAPSDLPILRLDGKATRDIIVEGGATAEAAEAQLRALFGIPAADAVTLLGAEAVSELRQAVYADLCLANCGGHLRASASFRDPGLDLGLTPLGPGTTTLTLDPLGNQRLDWTYLDGRSLSFTGCPGLTDAMGLTAPGIADWMSEAGKAVTAAPAPGKNFDCRGMISNTCVRRLNDGDALTTAHFEQDGDCAGRADLRIELPALTKAPKALLLIHSPFLTVRLSPSPGIARARLVVTESRIPAGMTSCILSSTGVLLAADGLPRLEMQGIDLVRAAGAPTDEVIGLLIQGGALALDQATIGTTTEGPTALTRGLSLCRADLYAKELRVEADTLAVQGVQARVLLSGQSTARSILSRARFGMVLSSSSLMRADFTDFAATNPLVLRGAQVTGRSVSFAPVQAGAALGSGLQLERGSTASFTTSTVAGFRCAVSFADAASIATFLLPGNDIARDNTNRACGPGKFSLIE